MFGVIPALIRLTHVQIATIRRGEHLLIQALDYTIWVTLPVTHSQSSFQGAWPWQTFK